eukprot:CAMPEP_0119268980 /NCGR_PEP_ID=MMETSP1329-20130426/6561_1 /TAXON_ID=114041 /ORGANISM="Genus nov. species nov., Strain RCC1024" /LENGTH=90 /DNA_ID=CAMNT_0007268965 /DNA_START=163 /DNA_END=432 /DNA_ORIENTATION=+
MSAATAEQMTMMATMFPHIPNDVLTRAIEIAGSPDLACAWLLENNWEELVAPPPEEAEEAEGAADPPPAPGALDQLVAGMQGQAPAPGPA